MSRRTPKLDAEVSGALLQVNPKDAILQKIKNGSKVTLTTRRGSIQVKVSGD